MTRTILCLSSIPPRLPHIGPVLHSLLAQDLPAREIVLYLPRHYRRFPDWDGVLPAFPPGIVVRRTEVDHGPATKILPALHDYAGQDVNILFCDDDNLYPPHWHRRFVAARRRHPRACLCGQGHDLPDVDPASRPASRLPRATVFNAAALARHLAALPPPLPAAPPIFRRSGHVDVFLGRAGVMVRPDFFRPDVFDLPAVVWAVDDLWLSGHLESNGVAIWGEASLPNPVSQPCLRLIRPLVTSVIDGHDRRAANRACIAHFRAVAGIWRQAARDPG